ACGGLKSVQTVPMPSAALTDPLFLTRNRVLPRSLRRYRSHHLSTRIARKVTQREGSPAPLPTSNQTRPGRLQSRRQLPSPERRERTWLTASPSLRSGAAPVRAAAEQK